ncbi:MAG: DUF1667 domain-containing protein [Lentisphaerae bacterium]|jgi:CxxC motif-containing protein|nr:DUF1667 domain-containing protein [Lentisphaerota bacterium]
MKKALVCISCPMGCCLEAEISEQGEFLGLSGNHCARGAAYARQECLSPTRMVTALLPVPGIVTPLSVRTDKPLPKAQIFPCLEYLKTVKPSLPVRIGDIIVPDILNSGVNIIATRNLPSD